jgi:hypothetical protein
VGGAGKGGGSGRSSGSPEGEATGGGRRGLEPTETTRAHRGVEGAGLLFYRLEVLLVDGPFRSELLLG